MFIVELKLFGAYITHDTGCGDIQLFIFIFNKEKHKKFIENAFSAHFGFLKGPTSGI